MPWNGSIPSISSATIFIKRSPVIWRKKKKEALKTPAEGREISRPIKDLPFAEKADVDSLSSRITIPFNAF
jgi:hypothetical protein